MFQSVRRPDILVLVLSAAGLLMVTMGIRQSFGLFVGPLGESTQLSLAQISLAMAVGQFTWGAIQPVVGAISDRYGARPVLIGGLITLALGCLLMPLASTTWGMILCVGLLASAGSGACSFSILIGAVSQRLPESSRGTASGIINAGGSFGQFVFAPILQKLIQSFGWMTAIASMAAVALAAMPLIAKITGSTAVAAADTPASGSKPRGQGLGRAVRDSLHDRSYLLLHLGFFTCGFHIAFLVTHLPSEVALCGLPATVASWSLAIIGLFNVLGSLYAGSCVARYRSKYVLAGIYGARALLVIGYLLAPRTEWTYYMFAAGLGFTWLATVPPTAAIVGKLFDTRYLATLFGLTLLSHQIGGFLGAWLGGLAITAFGDYGWMWYADIALAVMAALVNLPIKEAPVGLKLAH